MGKLDQLTRLDISYNNLITLPEFIGRLRKLEIIDIKGNDQIEVPISFQEKFRYSDFSGAMHKIET